MFHFVYFYKVNIQDISYKPVTVLANILIECFAKNSELHFTT